MSDWFEKDGVDRPPLLLGPSDVNGAYVSVHGTRAVQRQRPRPAIEPEDSRSWGASGKAGEVVLRTLRLVCCESRRLEQVEGSKLGDVGEVLDYL